MEIPYPNYLQALLKIDANAQAELNEPYGYNDLICFNPTVKPSKLILDVKIVNIKKDNCKQEAKKRIANCDWSVLPDVNITNKSEFESYRSQLRNLIINPVEDPIFPIEPNPIWSN
jgi:hypothetical protein